jgi:hypothetical protein
MKHNTHIYLAKKGIEFLYDASNNLYTVESKPITGTTKTKLRAKAKKLQRLLNSHDHEVLEASWAPDDILNDKAVYHTFKLFTDADFSDAKQFVVEKYTLDNVDYYRAKQGGGLPFKIDHLAKIINDMVKLRQYNDIHSMRGIMYMMILLSHYVVDAHVPMHCDIRDDSPTNYTPKEGKYYNDKYHDKLEEEWNLVTTEYAIATGSIDAERALDYEKVEGKDNLKKAVQFDLSNASHSQHLKVYNIENNQLMSFIINVCIRSKRYNTMIFPIGATEPDMSKFEELTRTIYAECIGDLISIWLYVWNN